MPRVCHWSRYVSTQAGRPAGPARGPRSLDRGPAALRGRVTDLARAIAIAPQTTPAAAPARTTAARLNDAPNPLHLNDHRQHHWPPARFAVEKFCQRIFDRHADHTPFRQVLGAVAVDRFLDDAARAVEQVAR